MTAGSRDETPAMRLVLLEVICTDEFRIQRSERFAFIKALASREGGSCHWISVAGGRRPLLIDGAPLVYDFSEEDTARLFERLRAIAPTHLITNERLHEATWQAIGEQIPSARRCYVADHDIWRWFGLGYHEAQYLETIVDEPDYGRELLSDGLETLLVPDTICIGASCIYRGRSLERNPHFEGVDLSSCPVLHGCSFCDRMVFQPLGQSPDEMAIRQILAAERTSPFRGKRQYLLKGGALWFKVERFIQKILDAHLEPSAFFFQCRVDEFLRKAEPVEGRIDDLAAAGHTLNFWSMGAENLSEVENARLNKGITSEQVLEAARVLHRWEKEHPQHVFFSRYGHFGFITFTPWTTIADLERNIEVGEELFEHFEITELFLSSRLQLIEGRPITKLAEHDGLTNPSFDDFAFDSGCLDEWDTEEIPWRFRHPEIATIFYISRRLLMDHRMIDRTKDSRRIQRWLADFPVLEGVGLLGVFRATVTYVKDHPEESDLDVILQGIRERVLESLPVDARVPAAMQDPPPAEGVAPGAGGVEEDGPATEWDLFVAAARAMAREVVDEHPPATSPCVTVTCADELIDDNPCLSVECRGADWRLLLYLQSTELCGKAMLRGPLLALFHSHETPVDSEPARHFAKELLASLERLYKTFLPE